MYHWYHQVPAHTDPVPSCINQFCSILTQYHNISTTTARYWPSTTEYQPEAPYWLSTTKYQPVLLTQYCHMSYSNVRLTLVNLRWAQLYVSVVPCIVLYFTFRNCSTLHIPCFAPFCTAHISANQKLHALFYILHCSHCITLHIFHALFCTLHCSHFSKLQIPCFVLYFALLTLQHISHIPCFVLYFALLTLQQITNSMLCSVFCTAHTAAHCSKLIVNKRQCTPHIAHHKVYTFLLHNTFQNA